jgi:ABC-type sugar transport system ATPase subunit
MSEGTLKARGVSKAFGHVQALAGVDFELRRGEILALVGDNGAGKSTLIKILSGVYSCDAGGLTVDGRDCRFNGPADAAAAGIATVYQDLALVDARDVAANMFLGREFKRGPFVDRARGWREAERIVATLGVKLPSVRVPVGMLSGGQRQAVAVGRSLAQGAHIMIMDEPTAALGVTESAKVLQLAQDLRDSGHAVLIVSHNLQQIYEIADRIMVLRLGRVAGTVVRDEATVDQIVKLVVYGRHDPGAGGASVNHG